MINNETTLLMATAATIGFVHTVFGPDHYLPFIVMAKARQWSIRKTSLISLICGAAHIVSSVVLGFVGMIVGVAVFKLESIESVRGDVAGWMLLVFGFTYFIWGVHQAIRNKPHTHIHTHDDGPTHEHTHTHMSSHTHIHKKKSYKSLTPWILFTIFIFGPCEPLIPLLLYPAAKSGNYMSAALVALVFSMTTITTMMSIILISSYSLLKLPLNKLERYSHALAGFIIFACGAAIQFLGL